MYSTFNSPAISIQRLPALNVASTPQVRRDIGAQEPDWSLVREADFSGTLTDWFGVTTNHRRDDASRGVALDLERALAYAG